MTAIHSPKTGTRVPLARVNLGDDEIAAAARVIENGQLCQGEIHEQFERAFAEHLGVKHAITVSSGSTALLVAMQAIGLGPGDEVIVPDITFVSTATAATYLGATVVFCDINLENYCIDASCIEPLINDRTKLIVPVHLGGRMADMATIMAIAEKHQLAVLEDAAGAHGAAVDQRYAGTIGDAAIFSFTPTKPITTGEGGMITTNDPDIARRCRLIRNFGDQSKFEWNSLGFNFRMTAVSAALGLEQLQRLNDNIARRRSIAAIYHEAFADLPEVQTPRIPYCELTNFQLYTVLLDTTKLSVTRDEVIDQLAQQGVASRLYYPALHRMPVFEGTASAGLGRKFPNADSYEESALSLPIYADMNQSEQSIVIDQMREIIGQSRLWGPVQV